MMAIEAQGPEVTLPVDREHVHYRCEPRFKHIYTWVYCTADVDVDDAETQEYEVRTADIGSSTEIPDEAIDLQFVEIQDNTIAVWLEEA